MTREKASKCVKKRHKIDKNRKDEYHKGRKYDDGMPGKGISNKESK